MISDPSAPALRRPTFSEVLTRLASDWDQPRISVAQLITALGDRGLIGLLLILSLGNVIPNPPGTSAVLGLPMFYLSWQMMRGAMPWLPRVLAARSFDTEHFRVIVSRSMPYLNRVERLLRPRLPALSEPRAMKILGAVCLLLTVVLLLPIPLGNLLPGLAIAIITLGALERDGLWIAGGVTFGIASTAFLASAVIVVAQALLNLLGL